MKATIRYISHAPRKGKAELVSEAGQVLYTVEAWVHTKPGKEYARGVLGNFAEHGKITVVEDEK